MLRRFDVHRVTSVAEAVALRRRYGEDAAVYAGGTEILLAMKLGLARWGHLIDVKTILSLGEVSVNTDTLRIGATITHWTLERHPVVARILPALARLEANVANVRVRAAGTLAGNLAFAEPHADPPALLVALGARVLLQGSAGSRSLPVAELITGMYQTAIGPDEVIVAVDVPLPSADTRAAYVKFQILERPSVGVAAVASVREGRFVGAPAVVVGAVDEVARRVPTEALAGADPADPRTHEAVAEAARAAVDPVADLAGSADYKRHLVGVFARRALSSLAAQAF
ncbi:MAG TPA: FAD binding domain-containing protein [Candidatus Limnocylindria bacterium]|jgi:carbon-monoxide dehydrogenase medium subunit|nr:FAD binding domain-containing protein [Candidatus Limnocylindria bacterium]